MNRAHRRACKKLGINEQLIRAREDEMYERTRYTSTRLAFAGVFWALAKRHGFTKEQCEEVAAMAVKKINSSPTSENLRHDVIELNGFDIDTNTHEYAGKYGIDVDDELGDFLEGISEQELRLDED